MLHDQVHHSQALPYGRVVVSHAARVEVNEGIIWVTDDSTSDIVVQTGEYYCASGHMVIEALEPAQVTFTHVAIAQESA